MSETVAAFVALGSNLGEREEHLCRARDRLAALPGTRLQARSGLYETDPVGMQPQGPYLNAVIALGTCLGARELLEHLLAIEQLEGRRRVPAALRWGPRSLDLDLLLHGSRCIREPGLEVPHPRLHQRAFVLEPLCELCGDWRHPRLGGRLRDYARALRDPEAVRPWPGTGRWLRTPSEPDGVPYSDR